MRPALRNWIWILMVIVLLGLAWRPVWSAIQVNRYSLLTLRGLLSDSSHLPEISSRVRQAAASDCRLYWHSGALAGRLGDPASQQADWSAFLNCGYDSAPRLVHAALPQNQVLAQQAVQMYPEQSEAWFWLAENSAAGGQPEQAIQNYRRAVELAPADALAWCRLGGLLYNENLAQSRDAFIQCCFHGDPGSNGCVNAGGISEKLGDYPQALHYYRLSHWAESHRRADELEARLAGQK
jgi:tetratricopeptide (TPR) repeat protein